MAKMGDYTADERASFRIKRYLRLSLSLSRFIMVLAALDSLMCIALWLAGGDSLYLEDSVEEFSFTHSTFDLVVIAAVRGVTLFVCFYVVENLVLTLSSDKNDYRLSILMMCQLIVSCTSLVYAAVKGGIIIYSLIKGTWNSVSRDIKMHITYKILCISAAVFPLIEVILGSVSTRLNGRLIHTRKLQLIINSDNIEEQESNFRRKANITRIIKTAKPVSYFIELFLTSDHVIVVMGIGISSIAARNFLSHHIICCTLCCTVSVWTGH